MTDQQPQETAEERAERRRVLRIRGEALRWAYEGDNMKIVKTEYRRRVEHLGEFMLTAWRRALWVAYQRSRKT